MRKLIVHAFACIALLSLCTGIAAQEKTFSYDQLFKGKATNVTRPLPDIRGWVDDENFIEMRESANDKAGEELVAVNVKTGKAIPFKGTLPASNEPRRGGGRAPAASSIRDAVNPTASPDGKW